METIGSVIKTVLAARAVTGVHFVTAKEVIRVTRRRYKGRFGRDVELVVTQGRPNYRERELLSKRKKAKLPLPTGVVLKLPT